MQRILSGLDEYLFHMFDELLKELEQEEEYRADSYEAEMLEKKYPVIRRILEGDRIRKKCRLSEEEQQAMKRFVELRVNMQDDLQIKYYLRGYHDCICLLIKCGILDLKGD